MFESCLMTMMMPLWQHHHRTGIKRHTSHIKQWHVFRLTKQQQQQQQQQRQQEQEQQQQQ